MSAEETLAAQEAEALSAEIDAFEKLRGHLEEVYAGKFVVFCGGKLIGAWDTFNAAAEEAVRRFGRGPYLIRQVGAPAPVLPVSVFFPQVA